MIMHGQCGCRVRSLSRHPSASPPSTLGSVAHTLKLRDDSLPVITLDLDPPLLDRSAGAKPGLQLGGKLREAILVQR